MSTAKSHEKTHNEKAHPKADAKKEKTESHDPAKPLGYGEVVPESSSGVTPAEKAQKEAEASGENKG